MRSMLLKARSGINSPEKLMAWINKVSGIGCLIYANVLLWGKDDQIGAMMWFIMFLVLCQFDKKE